MEGFTVLMVFNNADTNRYDSFIEQFLAIPEDMKSLAILKLLLAYSEEVYLSPGIEEVIELNTAFSKITRMSNGLHVRFVSNDEDDNELTELLDAAMNERYALALLPSIPNLLSSEYALQG